MHRLQSWCKHWCHTTAQCSGASKVAVAHGVGRATRHVCGDQLPLLSKTRDAVHDVRILLGCPHVTLLSKLWAAFVGCRRPLSGSLGGRRFNHNRFATLCVLLLLQAEVTVAYSVCEIMESDDEISKWAARSSVEKQTDTLTCTHAFKFIRMKTRRLAWKQSRMEASGNK